MDDVKLEYNEYSNTLRLMPFNVMLANFDKGYWLVDVDGSISEEFHIELVKHFRKVNNFNLKSWETIKLPNLRVILDKSCHNWIK